MTFAEMQKAVMKIGEIYGERFNVRIDEDFVLLKLYEEVGELAQGVLIHRRKCKPGKYISHDESKQMIANELADIVGLTIMNAGLLGVDLEKAIENKWLSKE